MYKKLIKTGLLILFLFHTVNLPVNAKPTQKDCYEQFNKITISEIQKIFSNPESWTTYQGQEGYLLFAKKSPNINSMNYLFRLVSKALRTNFQQLGWQQYQGSVEDFLDEREQTMDEQGNLKQEFLGMKGYAEYAKKYHKSRMKNAFKNVSAVLEDTLFQQLEWQQYQGSAEDFLQEKDQILNEKGNLKQEFIGMEGYANYAKQYYENNMHKAFNNVSAVIDKTLFQQLGWQLYHGSVEDFLEERDQILDKQGNLKQEFLSMDGYAEYAKQYHDNKMHKAFNNVSAVLDKTLFQQLEWQQYQGSVEDFLEERDQILDKQGNLKQEFLSMDGYAEYAKQYHNNKMQKAFQNVSAVLDKNIFQQLEWRSYHSSIKDFLEERDQILDEQGSLKQEYLGMDGYAEYAKQYHDNKMQRAFSNVSAVLDETIFQQLEWQQYQGLVKDFLKERNQILDKQGHLKQEYLGMDGYAEYAKQYHENNMQKAFKNVSAVLGGHWGMKELGLKWKKFYGSVSQYQSLIQMFENYKASDLKGLDGQRKVARRVFEGNNNWTYRNVSSLREILLGSRKAFTDLHWSASLK